MNRRPVMNEIQTYLRDNGWQRQPRTWNGASIWSHPDGREVLVPPHDDLEDAGLRVREILAALAAVEGRPGDEIASDISTPFDDIQLYRTFPDEAPDGFIPLSGALRELRSAHDMIRAAAKAVIEGPSPVFPGGTPGPVTELLQQVRLGPCRPEERVFTVRVPLAAEGDQPGAPAAAAPLGRRVVSKLHEAVVAVHAAAAAADLTAFDEAVPAGGSANLCEALSGLAGPRHQQPFEVAFRWGRGLASGIPAETVRFTEGSGRIIREAAAYLRRRGVLAAGEVTGLVESLHGRPGNADYWLIRVYGSFITDSGEETYGTVRVRLGSQDAYDRAMTAHRDHRPVRARGEQSARLELIVSDERFGIVSVS